ncbi:MAG TPA: hypothetical protein VKD70_10250 [Candidatus Acidoferrum sp.]|nr:hypothetical protein [Candidatus Acidoferrum sp.]
MRYGVPVLALRIEPQPRGKDGATYLFGFFSFTDYLPQMEHWSILSPWQAICFVPLLAPALFALRQYRKQMLDMDQHLIFEEPSPSAFWPRAIRRTTARHEAER